MSFFRNIALLVTTLTFISACGDNALFKDILNIGDDEGSSQKASQFSTEEQPEEQKKFVCSYVKKFAEKESDSDEESVTQEDEVVLYRHSQRVIRYGCDESYQPTRDIIDSDRWAEVKSPRTTYYLLPKKLKAPELTGLDYALSLVSDAWDKHITGSAYNETTCDVDSPGEDILENLLTLGFARLLEEEPDIEGPYIPLQIDQARHYYNMRVHEGLNKIPYHFYDKCEEGEAGCKEGKKIVEKGILNLNVIYDLKEKGEIKEVLHVDNTKCEQRRTEDLKKANGEADIETEDN